MAENKDESLNDIDPNLFENDFGEGQTADSLEANDEDFELWALSKTAPSSIVNPDARKRYVAYLKAHGIKL